MKPQTSARGTTARIADYIPSDKHMMITWIQKFHCKIVFQFDFYTWGPYLILLEQRVLSFKSRDEFFLVFFFKENILCILLFCIQGGGGGGGGGGGIGVIYM